MVYAETDSSAMGAVIPLRAPPPPVPSVPLVPEADALDEDDIDWSTFDG
jgi:hypothetical protein